LTLMGAIRIMSYPQFADVAELADAQVSEACDGDIVEVQVLSSAPVVENGEPVNRARHFSVFIPCGSKHRNKNICHGV
jgi:hypothetical protein